MRKIAVLLSLCGAVASSAATVFYNNAGYDSYGAKTLVVQSARYLTGSPYTITSGGTTVLSGVFGSGIIHSDWAFNADCFYSVDFSAITTAGSYQLNFTENGTEVTSPVITVADDALAGGTLGLVLQYFYNDRNANSDKAVPVYGSSTSRDVHGGWNDASGDVSKYLSHLSYANYLNPQQIPLTTWALAFAAERIPNRVTSATSNANFAKAEAVYGADFLLRMLSPDGFFYMTVFDGWGSGSRKLCAFSGSDGVLSANYQTAYREGGGMAIAALARASTLGIGGDSTAAQYLAGAERAFAHLESMQTLGGSCSYCDDGQENIIDDYTALLAASELYKATQKADYLTVARNHAVHLVGRLSGDGYFWSDEAKTRPFWHASDAGLPLVAIVRYLEIEPDNAAASLIVPAAKTHLNWLLTVTDRNKNPFGYAKQTFLTGDSIVTRFFIPHDNESNYWWQGENARLGSLASAAVLAARALNFADSVKAFAYAADQLDWILGKNPYGVSFMKGVGVKNPPQYSGTYGETLPGGIANGITGVGVDGSGIVWNDVAAAGFVDSWQNWRWIEQWLPHSTWYLMAMVARYDENPFVSPARIPVSASISPSFAVSLSGKNLEISLRGSTSATMDVLDLNGRRVLSAAVNGSATISVESLKPGVYLVNVPGVGNRKIAIR